jgi:type II secretory pathway component PulF
VISPSSESTTAGLARELTQATRSGVSLGEALLAAAEGTRSRRLAWALRGLAERVNRGEPLEQILTHHSPLPSYMSGLMRAGLATGHPAFAIAEWLFLRERAHSHWNNVLGAITYPLALLAGTYVMFLFLALWVMPNLEEILVEMGARLPPASAALFWVAKHGPYLSLSILGTLAGVLLLTRLIGGRRVWSQVVTAMPLFGPLWHWSGSSELLRALALLLEYRLPLPQALQLAGEGISDAALARHCEFLAARVGQGAELSRAMQTAPELPLSIVPLVRSGERAGTLAASLNAAAEMLESRVESQASMVLQFAPPVIFLAIIGMAFTLVACFSIPLYNLYQGIGLF